MSDHHEEYSSLFSGRYSSPEMSRLFSARFKITTFRKLWVSLAKAEKELGLPITHQQIAQMEDHVENIDFALAHAYEKKLKHDVMAHIHAFGDQCPEAKPIIHLGATSTFVTDNTDLIQLKLGLEILTCKGAEAIRLMAKLAESEAATPCLGYTHFQPAQPVTIGKRICLWLQDFLMDCEDFIRLKDQVPFLGAKGATGTQSSFLALFEGDSSKIEKLEKRIASDFGFTKILPIAGQTYTRKIDLNILSSFSSFAASAHKMATDIRLLAHEGEMFEGFEEDQVGSSAMPHKRNPIYSERICGLAKFVMSLVQNPMFTAATQWLERSLDDSSNRRLSISEAFLGTDAILNLIIHLLTHIEIDRARAKENLERHIPHLGLENLLMLAVRKGADRQKVHEQLKNLANQKHINFIKELGIDANEAASYLDPTKLIGLAPEQTHRFLNDTVAPFLKKHNLPAANSKIEI